VCVFGGWDLLCLPTRALSYWFLPFGPQKFLPLACISPSSHSTAVQGRGWHLAHSCIESKRSLALKQSNWIAGCDNGRQLRGREIQITHKINKKLQPVARETLQCNHPNASTENTTSIIRNRLIRASDVSPQAECLNWGCQCFSQSLLINTGIKNDPRNRPWRPIGLWGVEDPTLCRQMPVLRTGRALLPTNIIFLLLAEWTPGLSVAGKITRIETKNSCTSSGLELATFRLVPLCLNN
jgi:hypothetical protein